MWELSVFYRKSAKSILLGVKGLQVQILPSRLRKALNCNRLELFSFDIPDPLEGDLGLYPLALASLRLSLHPSSFKSDDTSFTVLMNFQEVSFSKSD